MSPEAILDTGGGREHGGRRAPCMKIGRASDVWSLGCILYQLVYGKTPFAALNLIQKVSGCMRMCTHHPSLHLTQSITTKTQLHCIVDDGYRIPFPNEEALHPDVLDTIKRCLRRDPTQRPPIAGGAGSLLAHPFLCSGVSAAAPEAAAASGPLSEGARRWVVKATLAVVDSDPGVLRLERLERVGAVCERVGGLLGGGGGEEAATALPSVREKREEEEEEAAPAAATAAEGGAAARKDEGGEIEAAADHTGDSSESSKGGHPNSWSFN